MSNSSSSSSKETSSSMLNEHNEHEMTKTFIHNKNGNLRLTFFQLTSPSLFLLISIHFQHNFKLIFLKFSSDYFIFLLKSF